MTNLSRRLKVGDRLKGTGIFSILGDFYANIDLILRGM
jgi:hypothetical protein